MHDLQQQEIVAGVLAAGAKRMPSAIKKPAANLVFCVAIPYSLLTVSGPTECPALSPQAPIVAKRKDRSSVPPRVSPSILEMVDRQRRADLQLGHADYLAAEEARGRIFARLLVEHVRALRRNRAEFEVDEFRVAVVPQAPPEPAP